MWLKDFLEPFNNFHFTDSKTDYFVLFNSDHDALLHNASIEEITEFAKDLFAKVAVYWTVTDIPNKPKGTIAHCIVLKGEEQ